MAPSLRLVALLSIGGLCVLSCAKGSSLDADGDGGSGGDGGARTSGSETSGPSTKASGPTTTGPTTTDVATTAPATGPATSNTVGTNVATSSTGGPVDCDPENPGPGCGASMHCVAQPSGPPTCEAAGAGTAYALCPNGRSECAPIYECVFDGLDACCMQWCEVAQQACPGGQTCTSFGTPVFVNGVEYGACWDGFPCVI